MTARIPDAAAIRAAVQRAADDPDPPSVLVFDEAMPFVEHGMTRMTRADWTVLFPLGRWRDNGDAGGGEGRDG